MARNFNDLTDPERAAMDVWTRGSADTTGMLCAVRAALRAAQKANTRRVSRVERAREMLAADGYLTPEFRDFLTELVTDDDVVLTGKEGWGVADLNRNDRVLLAAVLGRRVFRNVFGDDEIWSEELRNGLSVAEVIDYAALNRLRNSGLIVLPSGRGERYWEITDKALEG